MKKVLLAFLVMFSASAQAAVDLNPTTYDWPDCAAGGTATRKMVTTTADLLLIESAATAYTDFCIAPGDYKSAGEILVGKSCTEAAPCRISFYAAGSYGDGYAEAINQTTRAVLDAIRWEGKSHWHVRGITMSDTTHTSTYPRRVQVIKNSDNIVLDGILAEGGNGNGSNSNIISIARGSDDFVLQNSVVRKSYLSRYIDTHCVYITPTGTETTPSLKQVRRARIINNEIYDCNGDGIQVQSADGATANGDIGAVGLVIARNNLYTTTDYYTNCSGVKWVSGAQCSCGENAMDFKSLNESVTGADDWGTIALNTMWGYRREDRSEVDGLPTGSSYCNNDHSAAGFAINVQRDPDGAGYHTANYGHFYQNVFYDSSNGIYTQGDHDLNIHSNVFYKVQTGAYDGVYAGNSENGKAALQIGSTATNVYDNVVIESETYIKEDTGGTPDVYNNYFINAGGWEPNGAAVWSAGATMHENFYYAVGSATADFPTIVYDGDQDGGGNTTSASNSPGEASYCVTRFIWTDPTEFCITDGGIFNTTVPFGTPNAPTGGYLDTTYP